MPIITLDGKILPYFLRRSAKVKRLRLEYRFSGIHIVAPYTLANDDIIHFLFQNKRWLLKQTRKHPAFDPQASLLVLPPIEPSLREKFRLEVRNSVEKYSQLLGKKPSGIYLKTQRRRWGSCGIHDQIYINWILMVAPLRVLEYVVLHECCHLFYRNHGRYFWALVQKHMPDYKVQERWLRQHSNIIASYQQQQGFIKCQAV